MLTISPNKLCKRGRTSGAFHSPTAIRAEFKVWNRSWGRRWRMRVVRISTGGFAAVIR